MTNAERIVPLLKALARTGVRMLAVTAAYTVIAAVTVLWGSEDTLAWALKVSMVLLYVTMPFYILARIRFGRALRNHDPQLADRLGFFGRLEWDGAKNLTANHTLLDYLWRRDYQSLPDSAVRRRAAQYAMATGVGAVFAAAMIGSALVIVSIGLGFLPEPS